MQQFAKFICGAHSWYKHLPLSASRSTPALVSGSRRRYATHRAVWRTGRTHL